MVIKIPDGYESNRNGSVSHNDRRRSYDQTAAQTNTTKRT